MEPREEVALSDGAPQPPGRTCRIEVPKYLPSISRAHASLPLHIDDTMDT